MTEPSFFPPTSGDDLLDELEDSLPQGVANSTRLEPESDSDDQLDSLDALLAESVQVSAQEQQYKKDRDMRKRGFVGMSAQEVEFCNTRMAAFEMAREWKADKAIAIFQRFTCTNCAETRTIFSRFMEHHQHRRNPTAARWLTVKKAGEGLPMEAVVEHRPMEMCVFCVHQFGLDLHSPRSLVEVLK